MKDECVSTKCEGGSNPLQRGVSQEKVGNVSTSSRQFPKTLIVPEVACLPRKLVCYIRTDDYIRTDATLERMI